MTGTTDDRPPIRPTDAGITLLLPLAAARPRPDATGVTAPAAPAATPATTGVAPLDRARSTPTENPGETPSETPAETPAEAIGPAVAVIRPRSPSAAAVPAGPGVAGPAARAALVRAFRAGTLDRAAWTHEAHLVVARATWRGTKDPMVALDDLRLHITAYNARRTPTAGAGYHETLTRYHLEAVATLDALPLDDLLRHPWCDRRAPERHWSPDLLWSAAARGRWVPPDLAPLPW